MNRIKQRSACWITRSYMMFSRPALPPGFPCHPMICAVFSKSLLSIAAIFILLQRYACFNIKQYILRHFLRYRKAHISINGRCGFIILLFYYSSLLRCSDPIAPALIKKRPDFLDLLVNSLQFPLSAPFSAKFSCKVSHRQL